MTITAAQTTTPLDHLARALFVDSMLMVGVSHEVAQMEWTRCAEDPDRLRLARDRAGRVSELLGTGSIPKPAPAALPVDRNNALWRVVNWALQGAGIDTSTSQKTTDMMVSAVPAELRGQLLAAEERWRTARLGQHGHPAHAELDALRRAARRVLSATTDLPVPTNVADAVAELRTAVAMRP